MKAESANSCGNPTHVWGIVASDGKTFLSWTQAACQNPTHVHPIISYPIMIWIMLFHSLRTYCFNDSCIYEYPIYGPHIHILGLWITIQSEEECYHIIGFLYDFTSLSSAQWLINQHKFSVENHKILSETIPDTIATNRSPGRVVLVFNDQEFIHFAAAVSYSYRFCCQTSDWMIGW